MYLTTEVHLPSETVTISHGLEC